MGLGAIFTIGNFLKALPAIAVAGAVAFIGFQVHHIAQTYHDDKLQIISQQKDIADLTKAVNDEKASVKTAIDQMDSYEKAVKDYAATQQQIQHQIAGVRTKLDTTPILQKAQTDAKGASGDLNSNYADMLSLFNDATRGASQSSHSDQTPSQGTPPPN